LRWPTIDESEQSDLAGKEDGLAFLFFDKPAFAAPIRIRVLVLAGALRPPKSQLGRAPPESPTFAQAVRHRPPSAPHSRKHCHSPFQRLSLGSHFSNCPDSNASTVLAACSQCVPRLFCVSLTSSCQLRLWPLHCLIPLTDHFPPRSRPAVATPVSEPPRIKHHVAI
jgi:hypothetical protein